MTDIELIEQSFQIAWGVLERIGELGEPNCSRIFFLMRSSACCGVANGAGLFFQIAQSMRTETSRSSSPHDQP
jgi:hypothetical protein